MAYTRHSNGYVLTWDETISVGSLITAYHSGYHILTDIEFRETDWKPSHGVVPVESDWDPELRFEGVIFHYEKVLTSAGLPSKKVKGCCCASYCKKLTGDLVRQNHALEVASADQKLSALLQFC